MSMNMIVKKGALVEDRATLAEARRPSRAAAEEAVRTLIRWAGEGRAVVRGILRRL